MIIHDVSSYTWCIRYNNCSAWFQILEYKLVSMLSTVMVFTQWHSSSLMPLGSSLFFNIFQHQIRLPSSQASLLLGASPFVNLCCCICYHSFFGIKMLQEFHLCESLQRYHFVVTNTYCIYVNMQTYLDRLYRLIFTAYTTIQHTPNLLKNSWRHITLYIRRFMQLHLTILHRYCTVPQLGSALSKIKFRN